jgi:hypothetical protein
VCFWYGGLPEDRHVLGNGMPPLWRCRTAFHRGSKAAGLDRGLSRQFRKSSSISEDHGSKATCLPSLLLLSIAFTSFTCLLFTSWICLCRHGAALFTVEEFPPFDGRFSLLQRKDLPSYRGRISPSIVEGIWESWKDFPG